MEFRLQAVPRENRLKTGLPTECVAAQGLFSKRLYQYLPKSSRAATETAALLWLRLSPR
jgi:hypothetical protein